MRFAVSIPQYVSDDGFDPAAFRAHLVSVEELGFESGWVQEQIFGSARTLSPLEAMTYAAACTQRLRLGCAVFVSTLHLPVHLAKSISTLDCLSGGRVEVGIGAGGRRRPFAAFGLDGDGLITRFSEGLALMKACWTEPEINFEGRFWQLTGASMEPKPVQKPHPPIWIGGNHPGAVRRAVRLADGFLSAGSATSEQFAGQAKIIEQELVKAGKSKDSFEIAKRVYIHVDDDPATARARIDAALTHHYGREGLSAVAVAGPPDVCAAGLREVEAAGADLILLNPLCDDAQQVRRLAAEVLPQLA